MVVGGGPLADRIASSAPPNVTVLGQVGDANLRWLYASSTGLVAASYEDFGLTPVEAATFGKPTAALRWGGFLDTTVEGTTGVFFDEPLPRLIAEAVDRMSTVPWATGTLTTHARQFSRQRFVERMRAVVAEERAALAAGHGRRTAAGQEAPRPRKMVPGVCQRICMSHQNDHEATYR